MGNTKPQPVVCGQPPTLLALVPLFSCSGWCEDDMSSTMPSSCTFFFAAAPPGCPWLCTMRGQSVHCSFPRCRSSLTTSLLTFVVYLLVLLIALQHVGCVMPVMSCAVGVGAAAVGGYVGCTAAPLALGRSGPLFLDLSDPWQFLALPLFSLLSRSWRWQYASTLPFERHPY